ncbi:MAG: hypothetical protein IID31_11055 [Planctomycetes bacterium]|nr:hypothetical protein [Planctomycetota bacterium]
MRRIQLSLLTVFLAAPTLGQITGTYLLSTSNAVSPGAPTTTIGVWATWTDPNAEWAFATGDYDLAAGDGVFSNPVNVLNGPGSSAGVIASNMISGAVNGQLHIPQIGLLASRDNPILLATYDWTTSNFIPRSVSLDTSHTTFFEIGWWDPKAYANPHPPYLRLFPSAFTPGSGVIIVIPVPAAWVVLALPLVAASRRRRC